VPVPIESLTERVGVTVSYQPFDGEGDVFGLLLREVGRQSSALTRCTVAARQRFTIAHELGHFLLHDGRPLILDRQVRVNFRDSVSSLAPIAEEVQATRSRRHSHSPRRLFSVSDSADLFRDAFGATTKSSKG